MTFEEVLLQSDPYIYDASTPRTRIEEDLAIRRHTYPTSAGYLAQVAGIQAWSSLDRLGAIRVPTLIIHGETDQLGTSRRTRGFPPVTSRARIGTLLRASHIFSTDQPEASIHEVLGLRSSIAPPRCINPLEFQPATR